MKTILFVCTGNTCRSPMAEALFNLFASKKGDGARAHSAGVSAFDGESASQNAVAAAAELGADLSRHRARRVTRAMLEQSDAVYCMTASHAQALAAAAPEFRDKIHVLARGIPDPYGGDLSAYRDSRDEIAKAVKSLLDTLL